MSFNLFRDLLQFATMLVLVRLLSPASYGEFALTTTILTFITWISFSNFVAYIIQVSNDEDIHYQVHFTAPGVMQIGAIIFANVIAVASRRFPAYEPIAPYLHVMSIGLLLSWPQEFRRVMLARRYQWERIGLMSATGIIAGAIAGPVLAFSGAGTYSLLLPSLLMYLPFIYDLFVNEKWRPTWAWSWTAYRPAFDFGLTRISSGIVVGGKSILEMSVLTAFLGLPVLGIYTRALGLAQISCSRFSTELLGSIYPVLTRLGADTANQTRVGGLVMRLVAWASIPIAVALATLAPQVVHVIYGRQWDSVVSLLPWALTLSVLNSLIAVGNSLFLARQLPGRCLAIDLLLLIGTAAALILSGLSDALAHIKAIALVQALVLCLTLYWLRGCAAISQEGIVRALLPPAFSSAIAWAVA